MKRPYQLREWIIEGIFGPMTTGHWKIRSFAYTGERDETAHSLARIREFVPHIEVRDSGAPWRRWTPWASTAWVGSNKP